MSFILTTIIVLIGIFIPYIIAGIIIFIIQTKLIKNKLIKILIILIILLCACLILSKITKIL